MRYDRVLITGASAGLGEEFANQLAPLAGTLVLVARRHERLAELAGRLRVLAPQLEVICEACDLGNAADRERLLEKLGPEPFDLLVNNAGLGDYGEFRAGEWPKVAAMLRVNIEALTHLTQAWLPQMVSQKRGAILQVSSLASDLPIPDFAAYAATKAYVSSFSEALRIELMPHGIPVTAVCPGPVRTEFGSVARRTEEHSRINISYVTKDQVVREALEGIARNKARVYPSVRISIASLLLRNVPRWLLRLFFSIRRPHIEEV